MNNRRRILYILSFHIVLEIEYMVIFALSMQLLKYPVPTWCIIIGTLYYSTAPCRPSWWRWTQSWPSPPWSARSAAWPCPWSAAGGGASAAGRQGNTGPRPSAAQSGPGARLPGDRKREDAMWSVHAFIVGLQLILNTWKRYLNIFNIYETKG